MGFSGTLLLLGLDSGAGGLVRLEDLCWVLNPTQLCEVITGVSWPVFELQRDLDPRRVEFWQRQHQLASYFVGQLQLHSAMCSGRSSSCIAWLQRSYSYTMLSSVCYNPYLPQQVRAAAADFVRVLYLDRYPQLHKCGKPSLPEQLWVYQLGQDNAGVDAEAIPLVRPVTLHDAHALPAFRAPRTHEYHGDCDPFNDFPTHFKFFILRNLRNRYIQGFGSGSIVHNGRDENKPTSSICAITADLLGFGFQSSYSKFQELAEKTQFFA